MPNELFFSDSARNIKNMFSFNAPKTETIVYAKKPYSITQYRLYYQVFPDR
ncbi:hypothetical protein SAMN05444285_13752 [Draconibacterium orientale]|uniref:Uncharacterized protein n=1 Tax=Draconibacterium orientale TaxID=1168034 RepID=A0A1I0J540_9BACT|nr:hypothetical protein SAMN05444285_13752 [Draconibacterium orientale]